MNTEKLNELLISMDIPHSIRAKIYEVLDAYEESSSSDVKFEFCPKCGHVHPKVIKGGTTRAGKQMYRCCHCGKRFVEDHGKLTYYSHKGIPFWEKVLKDTVNKVSTYETHRQTKASRTTIFNMRHKILTYMELASLDTVMSGDMQMDEAFLQGSHKGKHIEGVHPRNSGERANQRGTSKQKVCIICAVGKHGSAYARSYDAGQMTYVTLKEFCEHVERGSNVITDDNNTYTILTRERQINRTICYDCRDHFQKVNLNSVNSFHSMVKEMNRIYRGVSTKYLNRYNALFSWRWQYFLHTRPECNVLQKFSSLTKDLHLNLTRKELKTYKIFSPPNLIWRTAA